MQLEEEEKRFEMIYREQYPAMYRYATALLRNYSTRDGYASGRAEEVVQEAFGVAWEKRGELFASTAPAGWPGCLIQGTGVDQRGSEVSEACFALF